MIDKIVEGFIDGQERKFREIQDERIQKASRLKYLFEEVIELENDIARGLSAMDKLGKVEKEIEGLTISSKVNSMKKDINNLKRYLSSKSFDMKDYVMMELHRIENL